MVNTIEIGFGPGEMQWLWIRPKGEYKYFKKFDNGLQILVEWKVTHPELNRLAFIDIMSLWMVVRFLNRDGVLILNLRIINNIYRVGVKTLDKSWLLFS